MRRIQTFPVPVYGKSPLHPAFAFQITPFGSIIGRLAAFAKWHAATQAPGAAGFFNCIKEIMSDAQNEHQTFIRTPKQLIAVVAGFFLVIVIGIILLVSYATSGKLTGAGTESQSAEAVAKRVRPVAEEGFALKDANAPKVLQDGKSIYTAVCAACHATGAAGAPKAGDTAAWGPRIAQGFDTLVQHAVQGIRAMPPKGGNPDLDNLEVARAVAFMANESGAKFKEPEAPAATATAGAAPAAPAGAASAEPSSATPTRPAQASATPADAPGKAAPALAPTAPATPPVTATEASAGAGTGKALYTATCAACHGAGIAGAPKFGDKAAWAPRVKQGNDTLYAHAIKGFQGKSGMMPPKGGSTAPDSEVKAAVDYMTAAVK
jgi:cytochrome c5